MLTQELQDFYDFLCPTQEEHQVRLYVYQRIKTIIQKLWPGADVAIFGSFETRLYLPSSDLDIVVRRQEPFTLMDLMKLKTHLQRTRAGIDVTCISHAKVPIVKFKDSVTRIPIDVSFNAHDGIRGASVVNNYLAQIPALRPLTMLVKHFMMVKDVNEVFKGGIGSYGTLMMILSFLQIHPKVQEGVIDPLQNLGVLLIEFFELYGRHFNYHDVGLSVADCGRYIQKTPGRDPSRLTALDPLDPNNDVTKASRRLPEVRQHFLAAFESLTRNLKERHRELFVGEREHTGEVSLIKDVLSVPLAVMKLRHHVETVFYQGLFQAMFDP
ncbi:hypothetical protein B0O80DRAFT_379060 [Mortierella sp. GBAus27b]|nr:hypothetical protein B0O80DRAFT_379060 [Mortierella sp. GBAus27b]